MRGKPEVLSPAGSAEALSAAVGAGADAVYFGLTDFNARIRARNFDLGDLPEVLADLRRWGVRSYLVFNTLVFAEELAAARDALEAIARAGPDGIIVQDLGVLRLVRQVAPGLPVHASTQMTVASADGVRMAAALGASRVILARELSLEEIGRIRAEVATELEVFVHGALCVSYSGQCLSSEAWGGRSANRGQCAQACRLPYDLVVDGRKRDLGDRAYLLSPRDLEGYRRIPALVALGLSAFKIEGRMKSPEYVAASTALYRAAVDRAWAERVRSMREQGAGPDASASARPLSVGSAGGELRTPRSRESSAELERLAFESRQVFSRGASEGFLAGVDHQSLVDGTTRAHRGVLAGTVVRVESDRAGRESAVIVDLPDPPVGEAGAPLKPGDGVLFAVTPREEDEVGGRALAVEAVPGTRQIRIRFPRESRPDLSRVVPGTLVFRTSDPALVERLRRGLRKEQILRRVELRARVEGAPGAPLRLTLVDPEARSVTVVSSMPCEPARNRAFGASSVRERLDRLGGTRYRLGGIEVEGDGAFFLPVSELNRLRREAIAEMEAVRGTPVRPGVKAGREAELGPGSKNGSETVSEIRRPTGRENAPHSIPEAETAPRVDDGNTGRSGESLRGTGRESSPVIWAVARAESAERFPVPAVAPVDEAERAPGAGRRDPSPSHAAPPLEARSPDSFEEACVVLCRDLEQVRGALDAGARHVALDFLDLVGLKEAAAELRAIGVRRTLALPRVQKAGEERIESFFLGLAPEEILVRNLGGIGRLAALRARSGGEGTGSSAAAYERGGRAPAAGNTPPDPPRLTDGAPFPEIVGDVSLNAVNPESIAILLGFGLSRVAPGLDLNGEQLESLVARVDPSRLEVPIYHHLPVFHTEHCVFAAFLSDGADFRSCGRPCDRHRLELRDRAGQSHPVVADVGCRNTVFGARPQSVLAHLAALRRAGVSRFRIELISQDRAAARRLVELHGRVWRDETPAKEALGILHAESTYGLSLGAPEPTRAVVSKPAGARVKPSGRGLAARSGLPRPRDGGPDLAAGERSSSRRKPARGERAPGVAPQRESPRAEHSPRGLSRREAPNGARADSKIGRRRRAERASPAGRPDRPPPRRSGRPGDRHRAGRSGDHDRPGRDARDRLRQRAGARRPRRSVGRSGGGPSARPRRPA